MTKINTSIFTENTTYHQATFNPIQSMVQYSDYPSDLTNDVTTCTNAGSVLALPPLVPGLQVSGEQQKKNV